jgi:hypothetical protein
LRRGPPPAIAVVGLAVALVAAHAAAVRADDYVTVRGAYYREPSTRVVQPIVEVERDTPDGYDVAAHYLVDAITSASGAAGATVDNIFTETRNEAGLRVRKRWSRTDLTVGYKYSAESDYWSHSIGASIGHDFWGDTARLALALGHNFDSASARGRTPECAVPPSTSCALDVTFAGLTYTQVLSPVAIAQIAAEGAFLDGFQGNLYRTVPNFGFEHLPPRRLRTAVTPRVAYYFPATGTGLQLEYRYYIDFWPGKSGADDPWRIQAHMIEGRVFQQLTPELEVRLVYRQYIQSKARFWCDAIAQSDCYMPNATAYSTDPKLGPVHTEYPEVKLMWQAEALRDTPFFGWFAAGTFEISYGHYFQNTSFGNAHVLQAGYTMPY